MSPLRGQQVYSADGTRWLGSIYSSHPLRRALGWNVWLGTSWHATRETRVLEWDRALGGWLAL
jgi:hypothetical protein